MTTDDEDFYEEMRMQWRIEAQRHAEIMTQNQDIMNAIAVISTAQNQLHTTILTAIADMGTGGDTARTAMVVALTAVATQMAASQKELLDAIAAQTPPPVVAAP